MPPPIAVSENASTGSAACRPAQPPARLSTIGSKRKKIPTVLITNWTKSVSVIDHMPPSVE